MKKARMRFYLELLECPIHHYTAIAFAAAGTGGKRLTSDKCCGRWDAKKRWPVNPDRLAEDIGTEIAAEWDSRL